MFYNFILQTVLAPTSDGETVPLCLTAGGAKRHPRNPCPPPLPTRPRRGRTSSGGVEPLRGSTGGGVSSEGVASLHHRLHTFDLSEVARRPFRTPGNVPASCGKASEPPETFPQAAAGFPNPRKRSREPRRAFRTPGNVPASRGELSEPPETFPRTAAGFPNPRKRLRAPATHGGKDITFPARDKRRKDFFRYTP